MPSMNRSSIYVSRSLRDKLRLIAKSRGASIVRAVEEIADKELQRMGVSPNDPQFHQSQQ